MFYDFEGLRGDVCKVVFVCVDYKLGIMDVFGVWILLIGISINFEVLLDIV